jgi:predicted RNA methylase
VTGYEIDPDAIKVAQENIVRMEMTDEIEIVNADISQLKLKIPKYYDTIIMNPPFGTRKEGIDMVFLKAALQV